MRVLVELSDGTTVEAERDEFCDEGEPDSSGEWLTVWKMDGDAEFHEWDYTTGVYPVAWSPIKDGS